MLKGIDPRLNAEVLFVLRAMAHGDALVISDTNFPSDSVARHTVYGELLRMDNLTAGEAVEAILSPPSSIPRRANGTLSERSSASRNVTEPRYWPS